MLQREEFVTAAEQADVNFRELCRQFGISPSTGYLWLGRYRREGRAGLQERSRRPHRCRQPTSPALEQVVVDLRQAHAAWGGRKLRRRLVDLGYVDVPQPSTITDILHRRQLIDPAASARRRAVQRFERPAPNELWQMDFKGHFGLARGRCHPLTILDDHSRYNLCLKACADERGPTVRPHLIETFERYGLPDELLCDNGPPWAAAGGRFTVLSAWLIRLGITVLHGRPYHPQTQGKDERFHQTLQVEVIHGRDWQDVAQAQQQFDPWREVYNHQRPHEALGLATPASRYRPSARAYPTQLPAVEYLPGDLVRRVQANGRVRYAGRQWFVSEAFAHQPVALRATPLDGRFDVLYCHQRVAEIDLTAQNVI